MKDTASRDRAETDSRPLLNAKGAAVSHLSISGSPSRVPSPAGLLFLQRVAGNSAVTQLLNAHSIPVAVPERADPVGSASMPSNAGMGMSAGTKHPENAAWQRLKMHLGLAINARHIGGFANQPMTAQRCGDHRCATLASCDQQEMQGDPSAPTVQRQARPTREAARPLALSRTSCGQRRMCTLLPEPITPAQPVPPGQLAARVRQIRTAITQARAAGFAIAADNMTHWLDGHGAERHIPGSVFLRPDSGLLQHLLDIHLPAIRAGAQRRATFPTNHPQSLRSAGRVALISYESSLRASPSAAGTEKDLSIALGAYAVRSQVIVRATAARNRFEILQWCVQICDRYDFNLGNQAIVPIPSTMIRLMPPGVLHCLPGSPGGYRYCMAPDDYFRSIESSGAAATYLIYSEVFPAPSALPAAL
jgi:hypothetical protein